MTELANPIRGPLEVETEANPNADDFGFDLSLGGNLQIPSSLTESGSGYQLGGKIYNAPNLRDLYWIGFQYASNQSEGGDFYLDQKQDRYTLVFGKGTRSVLARDSSGRETVTGIGSKNFYLGIGTSGTNKTLEFGSDIKAYTFVLRPSGRLGLKIEPHFSLFSGIPLDEKTAEERVLLSLQAGVNVSLSYLDTTVTPPQEGINDYDVTHNVASNAVRLGRNYGGAEGLSGPSAQAQEYTDELLGDGTSSSARLDDIGLFQGFSNWAAGEEESRDTELQLNATPAQRKLLMGTKAAFTAAAFALSANDSSTTMSAQGVAGALQLVAGGIGVHMGLDLATRRALGLTAQANQTKARDFLLLQSLIDHLAFAIGWGLQEEKVDLGLLQGAHQATLGLSILPDPGKTGVAKARSRHAVYEQVIGGESFIGFQESTYLTNAHLYTRFRLLGQTAPAPETFREGFDEATGRDPLREGAKAKTQAGLGGEVQRGPISLSAGLRTTLAYGEGPKPLPGVGLDGQVLLTLGDKTRFEVGAGVFGDYLGGKFQYGLSGIGGFRKTF